MREFSPISSNWRSQQVTDEYLEKFKIPVIADIDTRAVVRHLRTNGVMRGVISSIETDPDKLIAKARALPKMDGTDLAKVVTTKQRYQWETGTRSHRAHGSRRRKRPAAAANMWWHMTLASSRTFFACWSIRAAA